MIKMAKMAQIDQKMTEIWPKVVKMAQNTQKVEKRAQIWEKMYVSIWPFIERIQIGKGYVFDKSRKWKPKLKIWLSKICQI